MADSPRRKSRSRSPRRGAAKGFRWKEKRPSNQDNADGRDRGLDRGYRNRSPRRDRDRERNRDRDQGREGDRAGDREREGERRPRRDDDRDGTKGGERERDGERRAGRDGTRDKEPGRSTPSSSSKPRAPKDEGSSSSSKRQAAAPMSAIIVVHVNDRLGTKAAIPCLPSDTIREFKLMVAARIGREPHEILLKRQGERPFKDQLSLEDYGVGNGVQLDLEVDTGD